MSAFDRLLEGARLPPRIRDLLEPPLTLHLRGELPRGPAVAIVGTRAPSADAVAYTAHLAGALAQAGVLVLSGGARGIDTAAHEGALAVGGLSVVVSPAGADRPFPAENAELFQRVIVGGGGLLSEHAPDVPANPSAFFSRNALLAALAHVVIVVEAPYRSGAWNAAKHARLLGRPLLVVAHPPWNFRGAGFAAELGRGAELCLGPADVLRRLRERNLHPLGEPLPAEPSPLPVCAPARAAAPLLEPPPRAPAREPAPASAPAPARGRRRRKRGDALDPDATQVLEAWKAGATHPDEIAQRTGLPVGRIQSALLTLTLSGVLVPAPFPQGTSITRRKH
ncbi:MAG: DNA-processing protein DprA [Polyangiaceae bacterium]